MKKSLSLMCMMLVASFAVAQQNTTAVEPMDQTPVFRVKVVSRSTKAVNYSAWNISLMCSGRLHPRAVP